MIKHRIKNMERTINGIEEKTNEALEVIKEGVLERSLLHEEIEESLKQRTKDEKEEENEEKRKKQRRKKYALIDDFCIC